MPVNSSRPAWNQLYPLFTNSTGTIDSVAQKIGEAFFHINGFSSNDPPSHSISGELGFRLRLSDKGAIKSITPSISITACTLLLAPLLPRSPSNCATPFVKPMRAASCPPAKQPETAIREVSMPYLSAFNLIHLMADFILYTAAGYFASCDNWYSTGMVTNPFAASISAIGTCIYRVPDRHPPPCIDRKSV